MNGKKKEKKKEYHLDTDTHEALKFLLDLREKTRTVTRYIERGVQGDIDGLIDMTNKKLGLDKVDLTKRVVDWSKSLKEGRVFVRDKTEEELGRDAAIKKQREEGLKAEASKEEVNPDKKEDAEKK